MISHISYHGDIIVCVEQQVDHWDDHYVDDLAPMLFKSGQGHNGKELCDLFRDIDPAVYLENRRALGQALSWGEGDWVQLQDDHQSYGSDIEDLLVEAVTDTLENDRDNLDLIQEVADILGIICQPISGHGYCQGDYVEALAFVTPEFIKWRFGEGATPDENTLLETLKGDGKTYVAWAFGDVYDAFVIQTPEGFVAFCEENDHDIDDENDLQTALDEFDMDWRFDPLDSLCIVEQLPDFDTHPDIQEMIKCHLTKKAA
jgi:hypothetical protein